MHRMNVAVALSTFLLVSMSSAQQTATGKPANTPKSGVGIDTVVNCTTAKNGYIPTFTAVMPPNITICNSAIFQSNGNIGIGTTTPAAALDVTGAINTSLYYQIGGSTVLSTGSPGDQDLFVGLYAGSTNVAGYGQNTYVGYGAGVYNSFGTGNAFFGNGAGAQSHGSGNTFLGYGAGANSSAEADSTFIGAIAGYVSAGKANTFVGLLAGNNNTTGSQNVFLGTGTGGANTTGQNNTFLGTSSGGGLTSLEATMYISDIPRASVRPEATTFISAK